MRFYQTKILIILLLGITFVAPAQDVQPIPALNNPVTDLTATLTDSEMNRLNSALSNYAEQKGSQVVVLIIPTTSPEDIASYGIRVAEEWQIGRSEIDDGVLLLVAKEDRDVRIEVGYGLEGAIPDAYAKRIIENLIIPNFRNGQFYEGIAEGAGAIMGLIDGEELPGVTQDSQTGQGGKGKKSLAYLMILMIIGVSIGKAFIKKPAIKVIAAIIIAVIIGLVFANVVMFIVSLILSIIMLFANGGRGGGGIGGGGVFYGGGFGGGGYSGGGGFGGGFSGGGGGFGGGGASGSW